MLYKQSGAHVHYWEAWGVAGQVVVHHGQLGTQGTRKKIPVPTGESADALIAQLGQPWRAEGYRELAPEKYARLVVQYATTSPDPARNFGRMQRAELALNQSLGWTGNGRCVGNDLGGGTINLFCEVVDPPLAKQAIVDALEKAEILEGARIALRRDGDDEESYVVLWPEDFKGTFELM